MLAQMHLPANNTEPLQINFPDKSLKVVTEDSIGRFAKISQGLSLTEASKNDAATQTEEAVGAEEGCSETNHPHGASR